MAEANPMICPDCGVPMNHHADKVRKETHPDDVSAFDSGLGGVIEEFHTCPQCGKTQSRRAPPQRNELISHAFSGPFLFISEKLMPGWSRSIPSKANARRLRRDYKVFQSQWCFRSERVFFGLGRKPITLSNSEWDEQQGRSCARHHS